ncbi:MAG: hypothetical protein KGL53_04035, partial [Elusimicrobia bacterium]|nr:hypothetical protein [Elusimicrobiota bacterium]
MERGSLDFALSPDAVREAAREAEAAARARLDALPAAPDACAALDEALAELERATAAPTFLKYASADPALREAAHMAETALGRFLVDVFARADVYAAVRSAPAEGLAPAALRLREKTLAEFRRNGLDLPPLERARLTLVRKQLLDLELSFAKNLNEVRDFLAATGEDLDGLPEDYVARLERLPDGRRKVTLDYPDSLPFMANARSPQARRSLHALMYRRAVPDNVVLLEDILRLRRRVASLLGYPSYAHYVLEERMAASPETVMSFLSRLRGRLEAKAGPERERLAALKRSEEGGEGRLEAWDVSYYHTKLKRTAYEVDEFE